jgi:hypothetical protein
MRELATPRLTDRACSSVPDTLPQRCHRKAHVSAPTRYPPDPCWSDDCFRRKGLQRVCTVPAKANCASSADCCCCVQAVVKFPEAELSTARRHSSALSSRDGGSYFIPVVRWILSCSRQISN